MGSRLPEIYAQFEQNKFATAFYGDSTFFLKDEFWGDHNSTGMFMHYIDWSSQQPNYQPALIKSFFLIDLRVNRSINKLSGELKPIALMRFYCQAADIKKKWPLSKTYVLDILFEIKNIFNVDEIVQYHIIKDLNGFLKYLPEAAQVIEILQA
jgi:hypothetical protein